MTGKFRRWWIALPVQLALASLLSALLMFLSFSIAAPDGGVLYDVVMWAVIPLIGFALSCLAVRMGLHYYAAWIAPALCQSGAHLLLTALLPSSPGMAMVTLLLSFFGAATGEEWNRREARKKAKNK